MKHVNILTHPLIRPLILIMVAVCCASCMMGPDYKRPELEEKKGWSREAGLAPAEVIRQDWWTGFEDEPLNGLIADAVAGSYDLKILFGRIQEAGASITETRAGLFPTVELIGESGFERSAESGDTQNIDVRAGLSWELDLWGKKRRDLLATRAGYKAREADYRAGYLKLVSEVAQSYFQLRQLDRQIAMTEGFQAYNRQILTIYENQYAEGMVAREKVLRQKAQVNELDQDLLEQKRKRTIRENRIATLLGKPAGEMKVAPRDPSVQVSLVTVPVGLPSDLLARRPDIIAAEYRMVEAYHKIGVAQAERLPSFSLTGSGGLASQTLSALTNNWTLGITPKVLLPVFDAGRRKAAVAKSEAAARVAGETYRQTVMKAFEEVENALVNLASRKSQRALLSEKAGNLAQIRNQTRTRLEMGLITQLEVLDIERELFSSEKALLEIRRQLLDDTVTLYKALGGGWEKETVQ